MIEINTEASNMLDMLKMLGALGDSGALFDPLVADVNTKKKTISVESASIPKTEFVVGQFKWKGWKMKGKSGQIVLNCELMSSWISKLFASDEVVSFEFDSGYLRMVGEKDTARLILDDIESVRGPDKKMPIKFGSDFMPMFKYKGKPLDSKEFKKTSLDVAELRKLTDRASLVYDDNDFYDLEFTKKGSIGVVGSVEDKDPGIRTILDARVERGFKIRLGMAFRNCVKSLEGDIELVSFDPTFPFWMKQETDNYRVGYLLAPVVESKQK